MQKSDAERISGAVRGLFVPQRENVVKKLCSKGSNPHSHLSPSFEQGFSGVTKIQQLLEVPTTLLSVVCLVAVVSLLADG